MQFCLPEGESEYISHLYCLHKSANGSGENRIALQYSCDSPPHEYFLLQSMKFAVTEVLIRPKNRQVDLL